jgi:hypothetical protein
MVEDKEWDSKETIIKKERIYIITIEIIIYKEIKEIILSVIEFME